MEVFVYGVRHHGPGSARALEEALARDAPDVVAIEMPADFQPALAYLEESGLEPPVALVAYEVKAVQHALFYPLARFSPEWRAMQWALAAAVPVVPIDLPASLMVAQTQGHESHQQVRVDPLGKLAQLAGYSDRERWWERTFELLNPGGAVFPKVQEMVATLREAYPEATDNACRLREMHMARSLLQLEKEGHQRVGVVCGAWHSPVLAKAELKNTAKGYASAKRGLKGPKLDVTWIPYTYERMRTCTGYGAGVDSPIWYGLLYDDPRRAPAHYLTLIARELRSEGQAGSTAQVMDAAALAQQLAVLRELALPGLDELREAALSTLTSGSELLLERVLAAVESLRTTGRVPESLTSLPLQRDLEARLKTTRLSKPYRDMEKVSKDLDLRKAAHLEASQLLYQLLLLDIPFGIKLDAARGAQGTFKESWILHWRPDFALRLLTCHTYGQTIEQAAAALLREQLDAEPTLPHLTAAVDTIIHAGLYGELADVAKRIRQRAVETVDIWIIAAALPPLLRLARYASLRVEETSSIAALTKVLLPKLAAGLKAASSDIDDDAAYERFHRLKRMQPYLALQEDEKLLDVWFAALREVIAAPQVHPLVAGFALRTLVDAELVGSNDTALLLSRNLGRGVLLPQAAAFIEGFLYSSALVLIHQREVFDLFDGWLQQLELEELRSLLPALRRVFGQFSVSERRKLAARVRDPSSAAEAAADTTELAPVLQARLREWLGAGC